MTKTVKKQAQLYQITNKIKNLNDFVLSILNKTLSMFKYENLLDGLDATEIEKQLQINGYTVIFKNGNSYLSNSGSLYGNEKSPYNLPTKVKISIPAINLYKDFTLDKDAVLIKNDDMQVGLIPTIEKHGTLMGENDITMLLADYNARINTLISGGTDQTINSAQNFINQIIDGNLGIVAENNFLQDLSVHNVQAQAKNSFSDLIQYQQYLKADLYNELGLSSLNNMKKERMVTSEVDANNDNIFPLVDNMLENRLRGFEMVNKLFNGNVAIDFNGTWKDKADQRNTPDEKEEMQETQETSESSENTETKETQETTENKETQETTENEQKEKSDK